jgi:hypothetical protein
MRLAVISTVASIVGAIFGFFMANGQVTATGPTVFAFTGQMFVLFGFVAIWLTMMLGKHEAD